MKSPKWIPCRFLPAAGHITGPHCSAQPSHARGEGTVQREEARRGATLAAQRGKRRYISRLLDAYDGYRTGKKPFDGYRIENEYAQSI